MNQFYQLVRLKVSILVGLSSFAGACLFNPKLGISHFYAVSAALFLAFGCSALNQYQEKDIDNLMQRTENRPVPSGNLLPSEALVISLILLLLSICFILLSETFTALVLVAGTIIIYNFIYTPMKRKSAFSLLIGSVIGAFPPILGYVVAGGDPFDVNILLVALVLFLWQTPHFAFLAEKYNEDYQKAGFKTIYSGYGIDKGRVLVALWVYCYISALIFLPVTDIYNSGALIFIHLATALTSAAAYIIFRHSSKYRFILLNASISVMFILLIADRLIIRPL